MLKRLGLAAGEPRRQTVWALIGDLDTEPDSHSLPSVRMWRAGPHTPGPERAVVIAGPPESRGGHGEAERVRTGSLNPERSTSSHAHHYSDADDLLRPREVADLLGVRTSTIAR